MMPDPLQESRIRAALDSEAAAAFSSITLLQTVDSTNTYLLQQALIHGHVCVAEKQTAGRGRQGKAWISPPGNLYASLLWSFPCQDNISSVTLVVGFAMILALEHVGLHGVQLKWPNDLVFQNKKLGGILLEVRARTQNEIWIVIGLGLNLYLPDLISTVVIDQPNTAIFELSPTKALSRNLLIASILNSLYQELKTFMNQGLKNVYSEWPKRDALYQKRIQATHNGQPVTGIALGINHKGQLLLKTENQLLTLNSGEIHLIREKNLGA